MKYNTGDKVRIRKDLVAHKKYGIARVTNDMLKYAGCTATITKVTECELGIEYRIDVDTCGWSWTEEMFEPAAKSKCDLKVGDKVIFNPVEKNILTGVFTVSEIDTDLSHLGLDITYIKLKEVKDMWFISNRFLKVPVFNVGHVVTFKNIEDDRWPLSAHIEGELGMIAFIDMHFYAPDKPGEDGNRYCVRSLKTGLLWYTTSASLEFVSTVASLEDVKSISQDDPGLKGDLGVVVRDDSALAVAQAVDNVEVPQFKIGDKVVIRSDLIPGKKYDEWNGWIFRKEMEHYRGGVATVVGFCNDDSRYCSLDIDGGCWSWTQDSLLHYTPGSDHDLNKQIINQQTKQNYENQLQGKEEPLIGGCECTGTGVCYPGEQATACIGHLGYRKVAYKCQEDS